MSPNLSSTIKYDILRNFNVIGKVMAHSNLKDIRMENHKMDSLASISCFGQNSNAYKFSSNEAMILKLSGNDSF